MMGGEGARLTVPLRRRSRPMRTDLGRTRQVGRAQIAIWALLLHRHPLALQELLGSSSRMWRHMHVSCSISSAATIAFAQVAGGVEGWQGHQHHGGQPEEGMRGPMPHVRALPVQPMVHLDGVVQRPRRRRPPEVRLR